MLVSELIEQLHRMSPDSPVLLSSDPEGNVFRQLSDVDGPYLVKELGYEIDVMSTDPNEYDSDEDYEAIMENSIQAVILWP